jgi:hypothetical protein
VIATERASLRARRHIAAARLASDHGMVRVGPQYTRAVVETSCLIALGTARPLTDSTDAAVMCCGHRHNQGEKMPRSLL